MLVLVASLSAMNDRNAIQSGLSKKVVLGAHITEKSSIAFLQVKLDPEHQQYIQSLGFFSLCLSVLCDFIPEGT